MLCFEKTLQKWIWLWWDSRESELLYEFIQHGFSYNHTFCEIFTRICRSALQMNFTPFYILVFIVSLNVRNRKRRITSRPLLQRIMQQAPENKII